MVVPLDSFLILLLEIVIVIMSFLSSKELHLASTICKKWNQLAHDPSLELLFYPKIRDDFYPRVLEFQANELNYHRYSASRGDALAIEHLSNDKRLQVFKILSPGVDLWGQSTMYLYT
jgi:hypothetical protein